MDKLYIGVDVSKGWLDVAGQRGSVVRIDNTESAIRHWLDGLDRDAVALVAFEPTGGYERSLQAGLRRADIPFVRVHPNELVAFRVRSGIKAKTDPIDARLLAEFAAVDLSRRGLAPLTEGDEILRELVVRRRQLVDALQAERCRAAMASGAVVKTTLQVVITALQTALDELEAALAAHIAASPEATEMARLLQSLKGIGPVSVYTLMGELPELGRFSGKQIGALAGLAPLTRQSGKTSFRATTGHGRPGVRRVLFNAARSAIRWNPVMREFYERLVTVNRKPGKVALTAVMRKMLVTLNAIARDRQPWQHAGT